MRIAKSRLLWAALAVVALGAALVYWRGRADAPRYTTGIVDRGDVVEVVGATGTLEAVTTVQVGSQVSGTIQTLGADFNARVKKGQVVARLDPSLFEARLGQARAQLQTAHANTDRAKAEVEDARQKYVRAKELADRQLLPASDLDTAKANQDAAVAQVKANQAAEAQAQANLNQAQVDLSHTVITTPIDGVVISRNVDVGQTVAASFQAPVLFLIAGDLTLMRVNASVDEADIGRVREGQEVDFHVDAFPERQFEGKVEQVRLNPTSVQNVVTYNTIVSVDNKNLLLRPGMTATVSIVVRKAEQALRVPAAALRFRPEGYAAPGQARRGGSAGAGGPIPGTALASERRGQRGAEGAGGQGQGGPGQAGPGGPGPAGPGQGGWGRGRPSTVFVLDETGKPKPVEVRTGISDGQFVEIREGLTEGASVVTGAEIPGPRGAGPRPGVSPSSNPFSPQFQRRQR